jgi:basic amino acid/polyamine antiporter, APA family
MSDASARTAGVTQRHLLRILGVAFGIAVIVGSTIGAGILRTPGAVVAQIGGAPGAFLIWVVGGLYALLGAAALADLATTIPKSGGFYVYARRALGPRAGFVVGCADWFSNASFVAYGAITLSEYAALLGAEIGQLPGVIAIVGFTAVQLIGMRVSSRVQEVTSFFKAIAFLALIALLFFAAPAAAREPAPASLALPGFVAVILALQLVIGAYDGWQSGMYFAGEDRDPERNLPRAFITGVLLVIAVYLLMNLALMRVLPPAQLAASELPAADAAAVVFGSRGATLITALSLGSLLPLIFAVLLTSTRILYGMAADAAIPRRLAFVNAGGTPAYALLLSAAAALAFVTTGTFNRIAGVAAFFAVVSYAGAFVSLLVLRRREPDLPRPFRSWGYPGTTIAVLAGALIFLAGMVVSAPGESVIALGALLGAYLIRVRTEFNQVSR